MCQKACRTQQENCTFCRLPESVKTKDCNVLYNKRCLRALACVATAHLCQCASNCYKDKQQVFVEKASRSKATEHCNKADIQHLLGPAVQLLPRVVAQPFNAVYWKTCTLNSYLRVQVIEQDSGQVALPKAGQNDHYQLALVLHPLC